jgi:hypothetical protein
MWRRKIVVRAIIEYEITVPHDWDDDAILFQRNEGSWCAGSMINELEELGGDSGCICHYVKYEIKDSK